MKLHQFVSDERRQTLNVLAPSVTQKPQTLARTLRRCADANIVNIREAHAMHRKPAAADLTRDFVKHVELRCLLRRDREHADAVWAGTLQQSDHA
jgi:hypothetical protein